MGLYLKPVSPEQSEKIRHCKKHKQRDYHKYYHQLRQRKTVDA
jgi:hypothetical protein